jgi:hypothetical protein
MRDTQAATAEPDPGGDPSRTRWLFYALGAGMVGWGLVGLLTAARSNPVAWVRFAAIVVTANDGVLAPLVILAGVLLKRLHPARHRALTQIGLFVTGAVTLVALPEVLGYGRTADNPSALPLPYGWGLAVVVGGVWVVIGLIAIVARLRRPSR